MRQPLFPDQSTVRVLACRQSAGEELARMQWRKSPDSQTWVTRRLNFTQSVAVMSMTGYVIGLGDRHLSNIMLDRVSGQVELL